MIKPMKTIFFSRYAHLCMGLMILYGLSWFATHTSRTEKILESLKWCCIADYGIRVSTKFSRDALEWEYYRERYNDRLTSLTDGLFDYRDKHQVQEFLIPKGFVYDVWEEGDKRSYILAQITSRGLHKTEIPEDVSFNYYILGDKKVVPFPEYRIGPPGRIFVSAGEGSIYIHRDSLDYILRWYFNLFWGSETQVPKDFHWDSLTYSLYRDLQGACEDVFIKRRYRTKKVAQSYFVDEGFKVFLPTMLAMGARMAADQNSRFPTGYRYQRALLTGLSLEPNYTMLCLYMNPYARLQKEFAQRLDMAHPDKITLIQISRASQDILKKMEDSSTHSE